MSIDYKSPLHIQWNVDEDGNAITEEILNEQIIVTENKAYLKQIPEKYYRIIIDTMFEIGIDEKINAENEFKCDYRTGVLFFHNSKEGQTITIGKYNGRGVIMYPASRIYTRVEGGKVVETLGHILEESTDAIEAYGGIVQAITDAETKTTTLNCKIDEADTTKNNLDESVLNANTIDSDLSSLIPTANTTKTNLENSDTAAQITKTQLNTSISNANISKTNLENINTTAQTTKSQLDISIDNASTLKTDLNESISTATTQKTDLDNSVAIANTYKTNLDGSIATANTSKTNLDTSITSAITKKSELDTSITNSENIKSELDTSLSNAQAEKTNLNNSITNAATAKSNLDDSISNSGTSKTSLDASISSAAAKKSELDTSITNASINKNELDGSISTAESSKTLLDQSIASGEVLGKGNIDPYTPSSDYNPATKKYVDDSSAIVEQNANAYTDQQIILVTQSGIPKLNVYEYKFNDVAEGITEINIPLQTFDKQTDTVKLFINTVPKDSDYFTVGDTSITLTTPLIVASKVTIEIWKNIPVGSEGSVSGSVLSTNSIDDSKIGERTIDDTVDPTTSNSGSISDIFNWTSNRIKKITGEASWKDNPSKSIAELSNELLTVNKKSTAITNFNPTQHITAKQNCGVDVEVSGGIVVNMAQGGDCKDLSKWIQDRIVATPDTANKVFGAQGLKLTINSGQNYGFLKQNDWLERIQIGKCYIITAYLKNGNADNGVQVGFYFQDDVQNVYSPFVTDTNNFVRTGVKISPSHFDNATAINLQIATNGSEGQYSYVDGIMVIEITQEEYNDLTVDQLLAKYPYTNSAQPLRNPTVELCGVNLFNKNSNLTYGKAISNTNGLADVVGDNFIASDFIRVKPSTQYTRTFARTYAFYDSEKNYISGGVGGGSLTITTPNNAYYVRLTLNTDDCTNVVDIFQLEQGTTSTAYEPYKGGQVIFPTELAKIGDYQDKLTYKDGMAKVEREVKHVVLDGSLDWSFNVDNTQYKRVYVDLLINVKSVFSLLGVKYDGSILSSKTGTEADIIYNPDWENAGRITLTISDSDSGWGEDYEPDADEIKAYFNGWVMCNADVWDTTYEPFNNNGTRGWVKRYCGEDSKMGGTSLIGDLVAGSNTTTLPTTINDMGYTPYQLHYALQEPIQEKIQPIILGDGVNFVEGQNTLTVKSGVVWEKVEPTEYDDGTSYHINWLSDSMHPYLSNPLDYKLSRLIKIKKTKNGITTDDTQNWESNTNYSYGNFRYYNVSNYDPQATYYVLYEVLQEDYNCQVLDAEITYNQSTVGILSDNVERVANLEKGVSESLNKYGDTLMGDLQLDKSGFLSQDNLAINFMAKDKHMMVGAGGSGRGTFICNNGYYDGNRKAWYKLEDDKPIRLIVLATGDNGFLIYESNNGSTTEPLTAWDVYAGTKIHHDGDTGTAFNAPGGYSFQNVHMDDIKTKGFYHLSNTSLGKPIGYDSLYGYLWVWVHGENWLVQQFKPTNENNAQTWERECHGGVWTKWRKLSDSSRMAGSPYGDEHLYIPRPDDAYLSSHAGLNTGAIKITLPVDLTTNTMMGFWVDIFSLRKGHSCSFYISGYTIGDAWWDSSTASQSGGFEVHNVRFGNDGTSPCVVIGEIDSEWYYSKVTVRDFVGGWGAPKVEAWQDGWKVDFILTLPSTINNTVNDYSNVKSLREKNATFLNTTTTPYSYTATANPTTAGTSGLPNDRWWHIFYLVNGDLNLPIAGSNGFAYQVAYALTGSEVKHYERTAQGSTWSAWKRVLTESDAHGFFNGKLTYPTVNTLSNAINSQNILIGSDFSYSNGVVTCNFTGYIEINANIILQNVSDHDLTLLIYKNDVDINKRSHMSYNNDESDLFSKYSLTMSGVVIQVNSGDRITPKFSGSATVSTSYENEITIKRIG